MGAGAAAPVGETRVYARGGSPLVTKR